MFEEISFPEHEYESVQNYLNKLGYCYTTRVYKEVGKYKVGELYTAPWGDVLKIDEVQTYRKVSDRPFYNYYHRPGSITISTAEEISDKTFHFSQHTEVIYSYIKEKYPAIEPQARYIRVKSLSHILLLLEQADEEVRAKFAMEHRHARKELQKHTGFILKCPYLGKKEKITDLLLNMNLYRTLRPVFHRE